jgi:hypothetical protein
MKHYTLKQYDKVVISSPKFTDVTEYIKDWVDKEAIKLYPSEHILDEVFKLTESFKSFNHDEVYRVFNFTLSKELIQEDE